ncbi:hypothetical protein Tco_1419126 [Tanacetum coccineum]
MPTEMELTLEQTQQGVSYEVSVLSDIEDSHGPSDAMHNEASALTLHATSIVGKDCVSKLTGDTFTFLLTFSLRVFTMKMEILLEPTSNKLMVEHAEYDESNTYVLERFNTTAGNPVKKILLKLNLSDHRLFKDGGGVILPEYASVPSEPVVAPPEPVAASSESAGAAGEDKGNTCPRIPKLKAAVEEKRFTSERVTKHSLPSIQMKKIYSVIHCPNNPTLIVFEQNPMHLTYYENYE